MNNIALGRYLPLNTFTHHLDPRYKIIGMLLLMACVFIPAGFIGYAIIGAFILIALLLTKIKLQMIVKSMKPLLFMLSFLMVINVFVIRTGYLVFALGGFTLYSDALFQTAYIAIRLTLMITITTLLTVSTKPLDLTLGIEDLLSPFKKVGFPAHEVAMMISIALRFIPTLLDETGRIMRAQESRGVDFKGGKLKEKLRAIVALIVPLFVSALQRSDELANAMIARGYDPRAKRTRYRVLRFTWRDAIILFGSLVLLTGVILLIVYQIDLVVVSQNLLQMWGL